MLIYSQLSIYTSGEIILVCVRAFSSHHPGHFLAREQAVCASQLFPPFITSIGTPRNIIRGEQRLRDCVVNKVLRALERREQYLQAILTVKRDILASLPLILLFGLLLLRRRRLRHLCLLRGPCRYRHPVVGACKEASLHPCSLRCLGAERRDLYSVPLSDPQSLS